MYPKLQLFKYQNISRCECLVRVKSTTCEQETFQTEVVPPPIKPIKTIPEESRKSHKVKISNFFRNQRHLTAVKPYIPGKYLVLKRMTPPENLYLIDEQVAKKAVSYILPEIRQNVNQIVSETNAGLGLISKQLLDNGVPLVRLYESCPDFKIYLKV